MKCLVVPFVQKQHSQPQRPRQCPSQGYRNLLTTLRHAGTRLAGETPQHTLSTLAAEESFALCTIPASHTEVTRAEVGN